MKSPNLIFSNIDYYKDKTFQRLMRERNEIANKIESGDMVSFQMLENVALEFHRAAIFWFVQFKDAGWWREDLR